MKNIKVIISNDQMLATLVISRNIPDISSEMIYSTLKEYGVTNGIKDEIIQKIIHEKKMPLEIVIANASRPEKGKDGKLIWQIDPTIPATPKINKNGKADFKHLQQHNAVNKGQEIVSILPPSKGIPGKTVTGELIFRPGKEIKIEIGENIIVSDDGYTYYSAIKGYVSFSNNKLSVSNIKYINGDVSFRTGNIKYNGKVHIKGDIRSGFRVEATDTIFVEGNIEAADIYSQKGDVVVSLGIVGKGRAKILAGGSLYCGFIQDALVNIKNNIIIEHYSINSEVFAGGTISVIQKEGLIRGGKVFAEKGISALEVGSIKGIVTEVGISGSDFVELDSQLQKIIKEEERQKTELFLLNKRKTFLELLENRLNNLSLNKQQEMNTIFTKINEIVERIEDLEAEKNDFIEKNKSKHNNSIFVQHIIHKGVTVSIGHLQYYVDKQFEKVKIYRNVNEVVFENYSEKEGKNL